MVKRILPLFLLISCSLYHNKVDPESNNYQGWDTVSLLRDINGVNNSFSKGKGILLSNSCLEADTYDFQIRYKHMNWEDSIFLSNTTNILDISDVDLDYSRPLLWRVRGNKGDKNGPWSEEVNLNYLPIEEKNSSTSFSNYIYIGIDSFTWASSWDIEFLIGEESHFNNIDDKYFIKESNREDFKYRVRESSNNYKGFWSPWRELDINNGPRLKSFKGNKLLYGEFEVSNSQFLEVINYTLENFPGLLNITSEGLFKGEELLLGLGKLNRGYQTAISYSDSRLIVTKGDENLPVVGITYRGATQFCNLLNIVVGHNSKGAGYRLPTSGEWEGIAQSRLSETHKINKSSNSLVNIEDNPALFGNAWEWCNDDYIVKGGSFREGDDTLFLPDFEGYRGSNYCDDSLGVRVVFDYE